MINMNEIEFEVIKSPLINKYYFFKSLFVKSKKNIITIAGTVKFSYTKQDNDKKKLKNDRLYLLLFIKKYKLITIKK